MDWMFSIELRKSWKKLDFRTKTALQQQAKDFQALLDGLDEFNKLHTMGSLLKMCIDSMHKQLAKHPKVAEATHADEKDVEIAKLLRENAELKDQLIEAAADKA